MGRLDLCTVTDLWSQYQQGAGDRELEAGGREKGQRDRGEDYRK